MRRKSEITGRFSPCYAPQHGGRKGKRKAETGFAGPARHRHGPDQIQVQSLRMWPEIAIAAVWLLWLASWIVAALWADPAAKRPARGSQASYRIAVALGAVLLMDPFDRYGGARIWSLNAGIDWLLVAAAVLGLLFAWWARLHLGRLWSSSVTRKAEHRVIDTGPYGIVRHPIYTGIIAAVFATAILKATLSRDRGRAGDDFRLLDQGETGGALSSRSAGAGRLRFLPAQGSHAGPLRADADGLEIWSARLPSTRRLSAAAARRKFPACEAFSTARQGRSAIPSSFPDRARNQGFYQGIVRFRAKDAEDRGDAARGSFRISMRSVGIRCFLVNRDVFSRNRDFEIPVPRRTGKPAGAGPMRTQSGCNASPLRPKFRADPHCGTPALPGLRDQLATCDVARMVAPQRAQIPPQRKLRIESEPG